MVSPESKTNTLYLNGIVVGEVVVTGDRNKDMETARQFLKDKGIYKETTLVQAMFRQAVSFATTAAYLYERDLLKPPRNGFSGAPFVVNSAFSIELYLKTLGQIHHKSLRGHELLTLFDALPDAACQAIEAVIPACAQKRKLNGNISFRDCIVELNHAFVEWRYCYEKERTDEVRIEPTIFVMEVLHEACRRSGKTTHWSGRPTAQAFCQCVCQCLWAAAQRKRSAAKAILCALPGNVA